MYIVENVSTWAEEQPLCKPYSWRSELFGTNPFWRFDKVSDEIKPRNKKKFSFVVNLFYYSFCNRLESVLLENKVILQIW